MAQVTGMTVAEIEEQLSDVVVGAQVVDGYLIVTTRDGTKINAGSVAGEDGTAWFSGDGPPSGNAYSIGDFYLDEANGDYYTKTGPTTWTLSGNLRGPTGLAGSRWHVGSGTPSAALGVDSDFYLDTFTGDFYNKSTAQGWTLQGSIKGPTGDVGPVGPDGVVYVDPEPPMSPEPEGHMWYDEDDETVEPFSWNELADKPTLHYLHNQSVAAATWNIPHNLGFFPSVTIVDSSGNVVMGDVRHVDAWSVVVTFGAAFGGQAYLS